MVSFFGGNFLTTSLHQQTRSLCLQGGLYTACLISSHMQEICIVPLYEASTINQHLTWLCTKGFKKTIVGLLFSSPKKVCWGTSRAAFGPPNPLDIFLSHILTGGKHRELLRPSESQAMDRKRVTKTLKMNKNLWSLGVEHF